MAEVTFALARTRRNIERAQGFRPSAFRVERTGGLRRERYRARSGESLRERGEDAEVGVEPDPLQSAYAERPESGFVLQAQGVRQTEGRGDSPSAYPRLTKRCASA